MIRYTVLWRTELINELTNLWLNYPGREQISNAANRIDAELMIDAHLKGDLLRLAERCISHGPLTAYFRVDEADRKVFVVAVHLTESN